ncbi:MAG: hypothetical protein SGI86_19320, partial [Deltaproteobacteria bacterium]|nr:hypothetical protein [Deltaproteobacteria bacterium]
RSGGAGAVAHDDPAGTGHRARIALGEFAICGAGAPDKAPGVVLAFCGAAAGVLAVDVTHRPVLA